MAFPTYRYFHSMSDSRKSAGFFLCNWMRFLIKVSNQIQSDNLSLLKQMSSWNVLDFSNTDTTLNESINKNSDGRLTDTQNGDMS